MQRRERKMKTKRPLSPSEKKILEYIQTNGSITKLEATKKLNCYSLTQRIFDMKKAGYKFKVTTVVKKNKEGRAIKFARYSLDVGKDN